MLYLQNKSDIDNCCFRIESLVNFLQSALFVHPDSYLGITFVGSQEMRVLKKKYFGENRDADVLSFPIDELKPGREHASSCGVLGDIVICPETAKRQAQFHPFEHEMYLLTVHGFLHLLGFDHADAEDRKKMFSLQRKLIEDFFLVEKLGTPAKEITVTPHIRPRLIISE